MSSPTVAAGQRNLKLQIESWSKPGATRYHHRNAGFIRQRSVRHFALPDKSGVPAGKRVSGRRPGRRINAGFGPRLKPTPTFDVKKKDGWAEGEQHDGDSQRETKEGHESGATIGSVARDKM